MVLMIIKGLFRRYERWNPVHPTHGAFWGMGIGIGCGVGWGPGFGPEVIGYVGAGCGIGFSVGITLAGVGIGLPANFLFAAPYNAAVATKKGALGLFAGSSNLQTFIADGWNNIRPLTATLQRQVDGHLPEFNSKPLFLNKDLVDIKNLPVHISKEFGRFQDQLSGACKGLRERTREDPSPK